MILINSQTIKGIIVAETKTWLLIKIISTKTVIAITHCHKTSITNSLYRETMQMNSLSIIIGLCNPMVAIWTTKVWWLCHTSNRWWTNLSTLQWTHIQCNQVSFSTNLRRKCQQLACHHRERRSKTMSFWLRPIIILLIEINNTLQCKSIPKDRCKYKISSHTLSKVVTIILLLQVEDTNGMEPCHLNLIQIHRGTITQRRRKLSTHGPNSPINRKSTIFSEASNKVLKRICLKKLVFRPPILSSPTVRSSVAWETVNLGVSESTIYPLMVLSCSTAITVKQVICTLECHKDNPQGWPQNASIGEKRQILCYCPRHKIRTTKTRNLLMAGRMFNSSQTMIDVIDIEWKKVKKMIKMTDSKIIKTGRIKNIG